jgi:hypothetical protein
LSEIVVRRNERGDEAPGSILSEAWNPFPPMIPISGTGCRLVELQAEISAEEIVFSCNGAPLKHASISRLKRRSITRSGNTNSTAAYDACGILFNVLFACGRISLRPSENAALTSLPCCGKTKRE